MKRFRWFSFLVLVGLQGISSAPGGSAEPARTLAGTSGQDKVVRIAVVIGNSRYPSGALANPKNDATEIAASLKKLGFDVELKLDASKADMDAVFKRFSGKAEKAGVAALFYAGHGVQVNGDNYIVPIDANPKSERDLKHEMIRMDDVIDDMGGAKVKLVFFDACRDNPFSRSFSRGGSRGLAAPAEATGTLISFATKHGNTAADGEGMHSPYTAALLAALENPRGVEIEQMLRRVQQRVRESTKGQQEPWRYGSLDGDFYFTAADAPANVAKAQQEAVDRAVLDAIRRANEQAARERAELQKSMEKMLNEALARQTAALEAERTSRQGATISKSVEAQTPPQPLDAIPTTSQTQKPTGLGSIATTIAGGSKATSQSALTTISNSPGDEWEYLSRDEMSGKEQKLVLRVKAVSSKGVLEEIVWNGQPVLEWVFGERAAAIGTPNASMFMFAPHWNGNQLSDLLIRGGKGDCAIALTCRLSMKISGNEKLTVAAGTFDAIRLDGWISVTKGGVGGSGPVTIWYSRDQRRLLKQSAQLSGSLWIKFKETLELSAIRPALR